jgi:hypothetical protein
VHASGNPVVASGNQWKPSGIQCLRPVVTSTNLNNSEMELHWPVLVIPQGLRSEVAGPVVASVVPVVTNGPSYVSPW